MIYRMNLLGDFTLKTTKDLHRESANLLLQYWWSWRESNPRPNEELMSFLHAYLR